MPEVTFLSPQAVSEVQEIARRVLLANQITPRTHMGNTWQSYTLAYVAKTSTGGITAMSTSNVPGTGTVTVHYRPSTGGALVAVPGMAAQTVYNMATSIGGSKWVQVKEDHYGTPWIDVEKCT